MDKLHKASRRVDSEGAECTCASWEEHEVLKQEVDWSFQEDNNRAKMRQERNTAWLRQQVIHENSKSNGQHFSQY